MSFSLTVVGRTDIGKIRRRNEDSIALVPEHGVAVVADGMGGHPGGDVASRLAAETAAAVLVQAIESFTGSADFASGIKLAMERAVLTAHDTIRARCEDEPDLDGMGTTLTAMAFDPGSGEWMIGHVGDSRVYRLRSESLAQLTRDDTWIQDQIERGDILAENARRSPFAHLLTQCVGLEDDPVPQLLGGTAEPGDTYLLCTDGLVGVLEEGAMEEILVRGVAAEGAGLEEVVSELVAAANAGGGYDNITTALVGCAPG